MKKLLNEQSTCRKFETPLCSCKVTVISFVPFTFTQAKDEAKRLRSSAADQRRSVSNMESKISRYKREISKLRSERENKEQQLGILNLWTISQHWKPNALMGLLRFPRHRLQKEPLVSGPGMHHGLCVMHVPWCMSGSLTRDSRRMRNPQFNVSGKRPMLPTLSWSLIARHLSRDPPLMKDLVL